MHAPTNDGRQNPHPGLICPACRVDLVMSAREGVEIDYCPKCRGVWLDRGELDKIIERSASELSASAPAAPPGQIPPPVHRPEYDRDHYGRHDYKSHKHRRKSFLEDLFD